MAAQAFGRSNDGALSAAHSGARNSAPYAGTVIPTVQVLGIRIACLPIDEAVSRALEGGLVLAPSGPGLSELDRDPTYREALLEADINLTDSGLVILAEAIRSRRILPRTSGLGYLKELLSRNELRGPHATFWVMPSASAMERNRAWLAEQGVQLGEEDCYVAPLYPRRGPVEDHTLLELLAERQPSHIVICVGSGPQEKLGLFLKRSLPHRPGIHCIGAAIAFLTGDQAPIPAWADRLLLGWLVRCIDDPHTYVPRYLRALRLVYLIARYGSSSPPLSAAR